MRALAGTPESAALGKELRRRGWTFVGPTTVYAFMQAVGMVNDHVEGCHRREPIERQQQMFTLPRTSGTSADVSGAGA